MTTSEPGPLTGIRVIDFSQATLGPAATMSLSRTPGEWRSAPSRLGADGESVLADFGIDSDRASGLRANGVIA